MEVGVTPQHFVSLVGEALRAAPCAQDGMYTFQVSRPGQPRLICNLSLQRLEAAIENLAKKEQEETILYGSKYYEVLISDRSSSFRPALVGRRGEEIEKYDRDSGITYTLGQPTDEYLLFLMLKIADEATSAALRPPNVGLRRLSEEGDVDALDLLKSSRRLLTLRLESSTNRSLANFSRYTNALLFQINYNMDTSLGPQFYFDELTRSGRIARIRRNRRIEDMEPPKRHYIPDVVYHYQMGVATDNPPLEYLAYYHVAEHFFEQIFNDDLVKSVQEAITRPDFSYRARKDIEKLIKQVTKRIKVRDETTTFSEQEALKLTLHRHVDLEQLSREIEEYDRSLVEHYRNNKVPFSDGDTVNLAHPDKAQVFKAIAGRVYKTRNAIVHSKEGERSRYVPFQHDRVLVREVPIVRFIAESIILSTSEIIR